MRLQCDLQGLEEGFLAQELLIVYLTLLLLLILLWWLVAMIVVLRVRVLRHGGRRRGEQIISAQLLHALPESASKLDRV